MTDEQTRAVLAAGLTWLYATQQPAGAIPEPGGYSAVVGERRFWFFGRGMGGRPAVIVEVARPEFEPRPPYRLLNPLGEQEVGAVADAIRALGHEVAARWSGTSAACSVSLGLAEPAHPSLIAAMDRYHSTYPDGGAAIKKGLDQMVLPAWPDCATPGDLMLA